jgi:Na+/citrate or Na+/malate symporter
MSEILHGSIGLDTKQILSMLNPPMAIANVLAINCGGLLDRLGKQYPSLTGDGKLIRKGSDDHGEAVSVSVTIQTLGVGMFTACTMLILGHVLAKFIHLHYYALMIISVAVLKVSGVVPQSLQESCAAWFQFVAKYMTAALLIGVGVTYTDLGGVINAFSFQMFFLVLSVVVGAIVGAGWAPAGGLQLHRVRPSRPGMCMANMWRHRRRGGVVRGPALRAHALFPRSPRGWCGALILIVVGLTIPLLY